MTLVGNQLHSFSRRCPKKNCCKSQNPCIKLVIQVEHGKLWLPKGSKVTNYPKVVVS